VYDYVDSNYAKNVVNWKFIIRFHVEWWYYSMNVKKQHTISTSTTEAKYIALKHDTKQKIWMQKFINELELDNTTLNITLLDDNESSIKLMHNAKQHSCTKHINIQHHYIQNMINDKKLIVEWIFTNEMLADKLTKILTKNTLKSYWKQLEVVWLNEVHMQKK